jgi:hypothetical protein
VGLLVNFPQKQDKKTFLWDSEKKGEKII